ncbi:copper homeostasis protein CutC [Paenibacillus qinlingensis]|uniref:copper homeostasis protein CutC n=1 Tax=Paenibacillus qinlingensis TaxID=1837343 RepID=UPI00156787EA|nr:copper homeostasis protein CutC [Paenibacillus qinlingensis]NQX58539.1 copper homeostasis protein CutC [Paenibacillus qinlingensis]
MLLEVIATTLQDALRAEAGGADRIELVADLQQGGLTPDIELVKEIITAVKIPVHVMIRPHARSFHMSEADIATMLTSIESAEQAGASALVLGVLTPDRKIDRHNLDILLAASSLPVTFHRAFDEIKQQTEALSLLLSYQQIQSVLTSGGAASALHAVEQIRLLTALTRGSHVNILPGGGLTLDSLTSFVQGTGVQSVHLGTAVRENGTVSGAVEEEKVRKARIMLDEIIQVNPEGGGSDE